ncbi:MAG: cyclodeaminase/cyclohydrolase family protein [Candidatus Izemoplasmatales bacterium]
MKLVELRVDEFLNELASSSPAPGGGSVSALAGANGCSLMLMVGNLTISKKKFASLDEDVRTSYLNSLGIFKKNNNSFINLIDADTDAFNQLMKAFKLPKNSDEEIAQRIKEIDKATLTCIRVPLNVSALALETLRLVEDMIEYSNKNTLSDQGVCVLMLYSAIEGAAMNVMINLPGLNDDDLKREFKQTINEIISEAEQIKEKLLEEIKYLLK